MDPILNLYLKLDKERALEIIYNKHKKKVENLVYKLLINKTEVEDCVQEIFVKVFANIDKFKFQSKIETWIYRISVNHIMTKNKKLDFKLEFDENKLVLEFNDKLELKELENKIDEALNSLNDIDKKVFILREMEGLSYKEISKVISINEGTIKSKLHYIKIKLKKLLNEYLEIKE